MPSRRPADHLSDRRRVLTSRLLVASLLLPVIGLASLLGPSAATAAPTTISPGSAIEALAPYQGQSICDPVARPGVRAFRDLVLNAYPDTADAGIVRSCSIGGTSEHKEGRAWDWRVSTFDPVEVENVDDLMTWLLETDEYGNEAAMARRLGVMYVIWDSRVWKSYQAERGWQPHVGTSPHTDHVHVSFSWAGAYKATSYWSGTVAPTMYAPTPVCPSPSASPSRTASPSFGTASPSFGTASPSSRTASPSATASATACPSASTSPRVGSGTGPSASRSPSPSRSPSASRSPSPVASLAPYNRQTHLERRAARDDALSGPWRRR